MPSIILCRSLFGSAELGSAELGSAELGSAELGSAELVLPHWFCRIGSADRFCHIGSADWFCPDGFYESEFPIAARAAGFATPSLPRRRRPSPR
jgi:hypothetical protein